MNRVIVVNATAAVAGGALTIISEFIHAITSGKGAGQCRFLFFTAVDIQLGRSDNVTIINVGRKNYVQRILWDYGFLRSYLRRKGIRPDLIMSFQNTGVIFDKRCPQLIYYHNPFCLTPRKWNPFRSSERILWFYTYIYPFFVRVSLNDNSRFIVQANWIKGAFSKKFNVSPGRISVIPPSVEPSCPSTSSQNNENVVLFYPATAFVYKNHKLLLDMMARLKGMDPIFFGRFQLVLTLSMKDVESLNLVTEYKLVEEHVILKGYITRDEVGGIYAEMDALAFPSTIETFGLPLVEAAMLGKIIFCSDEKYSRETLSGYTNVTFMNSDDPVRWAKQCYETLHTGIHAKPEKAYIPERTDSWTRIFDLINEIIN